jgi:hypothetical protein
MTIHCTLGVNWLFLLITLKVFKKNLKPYPDLGLGLRTMKKNTARDKDNERMIP